MFIKKNGVHYTPPGLAEYLVAPVLDRNSSKILDPSYGDGALLLAAERIQKQSGSFSIVNLHGCDIKPVNGLLLHLPQANLKEVDFFDFPIEKKFQTIVMNPPYVRHHIQDPNKIKRYRSLYPELAILSGNSDLWAYFLIKAVLHLEVNGNIAALLPWSLLQAEYAQPLRVWLASTFSEIKAVALSSMYFVSADERIVVVWLKGYGGKFRSISVGASKTINATINYKKITKLSWSSSKVFYSRTDDVKQILDKCKTHYGFTPLSEHAQIKIGVVTGAVDYFIVSRESALSEGFSRDRTIPILQSASEFPGYLSKGVKILSLLLRFKEKDHIKYKKYLAKGVNERVNLTAHSKRRDPWYSVNVGEVPDAIFHYRVAKTPYLIPNLHKVQCTNSLHRIYFKGVSEVERKWIIVSALSKISQLSIEANSKVYGRAILKIEPQSLKDTLVLRLKDRSVNAVYKKIMFLLSESKKEDAVLVASEFISSKLKFSAEFELSLNQTLSRIQNLRQC